MIRLNSLTKKDDLWLKLLISKGNFIVDVIETFKANVSPVLLSALDDNDGGDVNEEGEEGGGGRMVMVNMTKDDRDDIEKDVNISLGL